MRNIVTSSNIQCCLSLAEDKPILDVLRPVKIENWREDGLFCRSKYSVGKKIKFIIFIRSSAFDHAKRDICEIKTQSLVSKVEIITDKMHRARKLFDVVEDKRMREVMIFMILREDLLSAHYVAKKCGYRWPQFILDFNRGLDQIISQYELLGNR